MAKMIESSSPSQIPRADDAGNQNTPPLSDQQEPNLKPPSPVKIGRDQQEFNSKSQSPIKIRAPDRLMVPKAFKYPERYTSPTDKMMSPVSRGILARNRKGRKLLPPSAANHPKIQIEGRSAFPLS